ncbi:MAG: nucleotidyltransferase family protein [Betaproteobacteria bacterium]|nr:nucleotidyltransferase family protein [Betaproteobacteria bacterium]
MKAMILAAGRGERMRPLTDSIPKPLLEVHGKPIIVWMIERLASAGFVELVINHAHLGHLMEAALGDGARYGVAIRYSSEGDALETAGGIAKALPLLGSAPFLVVNGDILCDVDFARLRRHSLGANLAHIVLVPNPAQHPGGDFALAGGLARSDGAPKWTFAGIGVYAPALFRSVASGQKAQLAPLLHAAMDSARVSAEIHRGQWADVGTPERLAELKAKWGRSNIS